MINVRLDYALLDERMKLKDLAEATGLAANNLSILKTNKAQTIRVSTLRSLCKVLSCTLGDLLEYIPDENKGGQACPSGPDLPALGRQTRHDVAR